MRALHDVINRFIDSGSKDIRIAADQGGLPEPYEELLNDLCMEKAEVLSANIGQDRWLYLAGPSNALREMDGRIAPPPQTMCR